MNLYVHAKGSSSHRARKREDGRESRVYTPRVLQKLGQNHISESINAGRSKQLATVKGALLSAEANDDVRCQVIYSDYLFPLRKPS